MEKIVIWGAKGPALVVADIIRLCGEYEIVGYLDNLSPQRKNTEFGGALVLGGEEELDRLYAQGVRNIIFGFHNNRARMRLATMVKARGFKLASAIHPTVCIAEGAKIGAGAVIRAQTAIGPQAQLGECVTVGYGSSIGHNCIVGDGVHIGAGAHLAGSVKIGSCAWIAMSVTVIDPKKVGENSMLGAGSVVTCDIPDNVVAYGVPARIVKEVGERVKSSGS